MPIVWQSLGDIALSAAHGTSDSENVSRLFHVQTIIAYLHSVDAVSPLLYTPDGDDIPTVLRKPPLLSLLQPRILVALSDATWNAAERRSRIQDAANTETRSAAIGPSPADAEYKPELYQLRPEVWLELILWSCIHGGYYKTAARLIVRMASPESKAWKSMCWLELVEATSNDATPGRPSSPSWLSRLAGTAQGYDSEPPAFNLPQLTVSSEVVIATLEGILSETCGKEVSEFSLRELRSLLTACKSLSPWRKSSDYLLYWNSVTSRVIDHANLSSRSDPSILALAIKLTWGELHTTRSLEQVEDKQVWLDDIAWNHAPPSPSILSWALDGYIESNQLEGAASICREWKEMLGDQPAGFAKNTGSPLGSTEGPDDFDGDSSQFDMLPAAPLPKITTAALMDRISESQPSTGDLDSTGVASLISPKHGLVDYKRLRTDLSFWPSLLRFAHATANLDLLDELYVKISDGDTNPSKETLRELLHCQISLGVWDRAESLLAAMVREHSFNAEVLEMAVIAKTILTMENENAQPSTMVEARNFLRVVLEGKYSPGPAAGEPLYFRPQRMRYQFCRILRSTSGACQDVANGVLEFAGRLAKGERNAHADITAEISISATAFNKLLKTVAATQGPAAGQRFFDRWCVGPTEWRELAPLNTVQRERQLRYYARKRGLVVLPNLRTIRVLLEPAESQLRGFFADDDTAQRAASKIRLPIRRPTTRTPWHAFAMGNYVDLADFALPPDAPHRKLIEWGWGAYQQLLRDGWWLNGVSRKQEPDRRDYAESLVVRAPVEEEVPPIINYD